MTVAFPLWALLRRTADYRAAVRWARRRWRPIGAALRRRLRMTP